MTQRLGDRLLSTALYLEVWERMDQFSTSEGGVDLHYGHSDFRAWFTDPLTFRRLGDHFLRESNVIMAAEVE